MLVVDYCIDADTIRMSNGDKVRILGIDGYDKNKKQQDKQIKRTGKTRKEVYKLYLDGKEFCKITLQGKRVKLVKDKQDKDIFNRKLRYVYIDNLDYSELILKKKLALVYCNNKRIKNYKYYNSISEFRCK